jgi:hypothetical protein
VRRALKANGMFGLAAIIDYRFFQVVADITGEPLFLRAKIDFAGLRYVLRERAVHCPAQLCLDASRLAPIRLVLRPMTNAPHLR